MLVVVSVGGSEVVVLVLTGGAVVLERVVG